MGMYTELVFGASLDIPKKEFNILSFLIDPSNKEYPESWPQIWQELSRMRWVLVGQSSYYFGARWQPPFLHINKNDYEQSKTPGNVSCFLSIRSNIKNYDGEIEKFLDWIKPFIEKGSGNWDMYATVIYEDTEEPTIYYLNKD
jgi:hypothetical protein